MSVVDTAALRATAEAAGEVRPGHWKTWGLEVLADPRGTSNLDDGVHVAQTNLTIDGKPRTHLCDHIATFDPRTVLALLYELDTLRATVARIEALADELDDIDPHPWTLLDGVCVGGAIRYALVSPTPDPTEACECVGYTIRTDYGTGTEHDVDRSSCPTHGDPTTP